jgi:aminoglycoside 6'-N-acetyltransferase
MNTFGNEISFAPIRHKHLELIQEWFSTNEYLHKNWDPDLKIDQIMQKFGSKIHHESVNGWIIFYGGKPIGYYQDYEIHGHDQIWEYCKGKSVGIDLFIGDKDFYGKGIGVSGIKIISKILGKRYMTVVADPLVNNEISIKAFEKAGFKKAGVLELDFSTHQVMTKEYCGSLED